VSSLRTELDAGHPVLGVWSSYPTAAAVEVLASSEADFVVLDLQHGAATWESVVDLVRVIDLLGKPAMVRVGRNDPADVMRALDLGASGVIVPAVESAEEAARVAAAARYPMDGIRSFGPLRGARPTETANAEVICLPMIETAAGLRNLEAIVDTTGITGVFVGPVDLSLSLGHGAQVAPFAPQVLDAIDRMVEVCAARGKVVGTVGTSAAVYEDLLVRGVRLLTVGNERTYVAEGIERHLAQARGTGTRAGTGSARVTTS
jgi:4-hydroxy-2-oxoheptanedioate aldolase